MAKSSKLIMKKEEGEDFGIPKEIIEKIRLKKPKPYEKIIKVIMDKNQALIRFPTVMTSAYNLTRNDKFKLIIEKEKPLTIKLKRE